MSLSLRAGRASLLGLSALAIIMTMAACAPANSEHLQDGQSDEQTVESTPAADNSSETSPSHNVVNNGSYVDVNPQDPSTASDILSKYSNLDLQRLVPRNLLAAALTYFDSHQSTIRNKSYVSVIDFAMPSTKRRFFIINMASGTVFATTMAHGRGSDPKNNGFAEKFSNINDSKMSSLGIYLTDTTYYGGDGYSLHLDGMSSTNSNARMRQVVLHGAAYVQDREVTQGRSWGCPAVPMNYRDRIIGWLKGGSVIYANLSTK